MPPATRPAAYTIRIAASRGKSCRPWAMPCSAASAVVAATPTATQTAAAGPPRDRKRSSTGAASTPTTSIVPAAASPSPTASAAAPAPAPPARTTRTATTACSASAGTEATSVTASSATNSPYCSGASSRAPARLSPYERTLATVVPAATAIPPAAVRPTGGPDSVELVVLRLAPNGRRRLALVSRIATPRRLTRVLRRARSSGPGARTRRR